MSAATGPLPNLSFEDGGPRGPLDRDIWQWMERGRQIDPSATAVISLHQASDHLSWLTKRRFDSTTSYLSWSYAQLEEASVTVAAHLSAHGVGSQDVIALFVPDSVEWAIFFWAAILLGATFIPVEMKVVHDDEGLLYTMGVARATVIVMNDSDLVAPFDLTVQKAELAVPIKLKMVCRPILHQKISETQSTPEWQSISNVRPPDSASGFQHVEPAKDSKAIILFTSGTTGKPKACAITHPSFCVQCDGYAAYRATASGRWSPKMRFVQASANFKPTCWLACFSTWRNGGALVIPGPAFDARSMLEAMADKELAVTHVFLVPRLVRALVSHPDLVSGKLVPVNMKYVNITGDVIDRGLLELCKDKLKVENVVSVWGMTEGAGIMAWSREGDAVPFTNKAQGELVGLGHILPGAKVKVCANGMNTPVERGVVGNMHVSAANFITSYCEGRDPDSFYTDTNGTKWLIPGDKAVMDETGMVFLMGRSKDMIEHGDTILVPASIQAVIEQSDDVLDAQVVGLANDEFGQVPVAVVKPRQGSIPNIETLNESIQGELGEEHKLAEMHTLNEVGLKDWPYNSMGKVMKKDIALAVAEFKR